MKAVGHVAPLVALVGLGALLGPRLLKARERAPARSTP